MRNPIFIALSGAFLVLVAGCGSPDPTLDGGQTVDAARPLDAAGRDAAGRDAAGRDAAGRDAAGTDGGDPCAGVTCSGRGRCQVEAGAPACACDAGYRIEGLSCVAEGQRFPHVKTFGFDYWYLGDDLPQLTALGERRDVIIGGFSWTDRRFTEAQWTTVQALDPPPRLIGYFAYHSQNIRPGGSRDLMETWAVDNGFRREEIYCHYQEDSTVRVTGTVTNGQVVGLRNGTPPTITVGANQELFAGERIVISGVNGGGHPVNGAWIVLPATDSTRTEYQLFRPGSPPGAVDGSGWATLSSEGAFESDNCAGGDCTITVPGWPDGWATKESDSRVLARWNGGWPAVCPLQEAWRRSSESRVLDMVSVRGGGAYIDGIFLDSFGGMALSDGYWGESLNNIRELRTRIGDTPTHDEAEQAMWVAIVDAAIELDDFLETRTGNPNFMTIPNGADIRGVYRTEEPRWRGTDGRRLESFAIEFMAASTTNLNLIPEMQALYEDLESGSRVFVRSQTNVTGARVTHAFGGFLLGANYMLNHPNGWFWVHEGNAGFYGGSPAGTLIDTSITPPGGTHWMPNQEVDIGAPLRRPEPDYWGEADTDRFYDLDPSHPSGHIILAREFENALILARFGTGGIANVGNGASTVSLGGTFYPLQPDNTTSGAVTEWTFGQSEGVILMRSPR